MKRCWPAGVPAILDASFQNATLDADGVRMTARQSGRSLVVGGTGMLAKATRWLADRSATTMLVARHASRFSAGDSRYVPLDSDWTASAFRDDLTQALDETPVARALLWLHHPGQILPWLLPLLSRTYVVLVLGSLDGRPSVPDGATHVVSVRLGSKRSPGGGRRWLADEEISEGAILAFTSGQSQLVGDLRAV